MKTQHSCVQDHLQKFLQVQNAGFLHKDMECLMLQAVSRILVTYISTNGIEFAEEEVTQIKAGGTVSLKKGTSYQLGEGTWNVSGDATNYSGGITFYVSEDGDYNFTQQ